MDPANLLTKWHWIVELARKKPGTVLYSLNHVIDFEWMREAYIRTRKDGATGIDGVTAQDYEANLEANLRDLLERIKSGSYEAPPVRRTYIPKADGSQRPIGIPSFEDKVAQRAVAMVLEAVYEQDFLSCSYGFRPRRSAHQAPSTPPPSMHCSAAAPRARARPAAVRRRPDLGRGDRRRLRP